MKMKESISDRLFGKRYIELPDKKRVYDKRSDSFLILFFVALLFVFSLQITGFNLPVLFKKLGNMQMILTQIFQPKWSVIPAILPAIGETIMISSAGTIIGVLLALPVAIFSSYNVNSNRYLLFLLRVAISIIRSFPTMIIAIVLTLIFNVGSLAGTFAIAIFSFSTVTKMLIESIETLDMRAFESMQSMGATKFRSFWIACMPQILSTYVSHALYSFEINVRTASILGYVGAGGIGIIMNEKISWRDYNSLGSIILVLFILVILINTLSRAFRKKYQN